MTLERILQIAIMKADKRFEKVGGTTRHYVREYLIEELNDELLSKDEVCQAMVDAEEDWDHYDGSLYDYIEDLAKRLDFTPEQLVKIGVLHPSELDNK